ncbi:hypothetical protein [Rhodosalinus sp. K401]|uniref:hypothetical protein n=1 Tax=Rhodosalinus sp. K401 TaxID=3239195 RepID=UPI00352317FF
MMGRARRLRAGLAASLLSALAAPAAAERITPLPYEELPPLAPELLTFERLPAKPYPGYVFDHGIAFAGGRIGERFAGQTLGEVTLDEGGPHDVLRGRPTAPLAVEPGAPGEGVSLSLHSAFRSMALYPLGPLGQPDPEARGEGAAAILFHEDACAFGLRVHTEYTDAFGANEGHLGEIDLTFYARDGAEIGRVTVLAPEHISGHGFLDTGGGIAGVTVENRDPGGISFDDVRFGCPNVTG